MYCKNCLAPLSEADTYCKVCGKPVEKSTTYPSNEDIIASYQTEESAPIFPEVKEVVTEPVTTQTQSIEQTNVLKPVMMEEKSESMPTNPVDQVVAPATPFVPNMEVPLPPVSRPEPLPIVSEKKGIEKKFFALGIVIAVIATALIAALICIPIVSSKVEKAKKEVLETPLVPTVVKENRVLFSGYSFLIPEGYRYKINGKELIVEKIDTKEAMSLQVGTETYANLKANLTVLKTNLTKAKWGVGKLYMDQAIKNRIYLTVEASVNQQKLMIAYTKANAKQVFAIVYLNPTSKEYPKETMETFHEIVDSGAEIMNSPTTKITNFTKNNLFFPKTTK